MRASASANRTCLAIALALATAVGVGCRELRVREIPMVPPAPPLGTAKLVVLNQGPRETEIAMRCEQGGRFENKTAVPYGQPMIFTLPPGKYYASAVSPMASRVVRKTRGAMVLSEGKCYEWVVGSKTE